MTTQLRPIEALARERERKGYNVINELQRILHRAVSKPSKCATPIPGPDTIFIQDSPAAIEFLIECGFVRGGDELPHARRNSVSSAQPSSSRSISPAPIAPDVTPDRTGVEASPSPDPTTPTSSSLPTPHPNSIASVLYLPVVPHEHSSNWIAMQASFNKALDMLKWALQCNTGLLTIKAHRLTMFNIPPFNQDMRLQVIVEWKDELGQDRSERHVSPWCGQEVTRPISVPLSSFQTVSPTSAIGDQKAPSSSGIPTPPSSALAPPFGTMYSGLLATFPTTCDRPCFISISVAKKRNYLSGEKVKGFGLLGVANDRCVLSDIDLKDPHHDGGLPVGRITVEVDSVRLRCKAASDSAFAALEPQQQQQGEEKGSQQEDNGLADAPSSSGGGGEDGDGVPEQAPEMMRESKLWIEQEKLRELANKAKTETRRVYDADDYF